ncbi:MAG: hypothetical protein U5K33_09435 [Halofilum sp. (in: g-proteobacteria)]|nr:hypothetical protein [Halofilum sp. (in: g-proteobacteria)]
MNDEWETNGESIHCRFLEIAADISRPLEQALIAVGPRRFPDRSDVPPAVFLARAVVGQQLSTAAARSIWQRIEAMAAAEGCAIPDAFDEARREQLRACGLSAGKARTLAGIREAHRAGRLERDALRSLDHAGITAELTTLWGVGQWTSDMAALFYCRCPDVWPEQDVTVRKTFSRLIGTRRKPSKWAARFAPYRSWLALYMWAVVDARPD